MRHLGSLRSCTTHQSRWNFADVSYESLRGRLLSGESFEDRHKDAFNRKQKIGSPLHLGKRDEELTLDYGVDHLKLRISTCCSVTNGIAAEAYTLHSDCANPCERLASADGRRYNIRKDG